MHVKICGITNAEDARAAAYFGASAIGLNFFPGSPRHVSLASAQAILADLPPLVQPVGVIVVRRTETLATHLERLATFPVVQVHADTLELPPRGAQRFIAAFPVKDEQSLTRARRYIQQCQDESRPLAGVLADAAVAGQYGGTGRTAPWRLLADAEFPLPLILAGGLTPENVAEAIRVVRPFAVDVASGVESAPGRKDHQKMQRFIGEAREAFARFPPRPSSC